MASPRSEGTGATRAAGLLAAAVSALLLVVVVARDVGLNALNGWTIAAGFVGATLLLLHGGSRTLVGASAVVLLLGALPAMLGGYGLLYVPSIVLAARAATCAGTQVSARA